MRRQRFEQNGRYSDASVQGTGIPQFGQDTVMRGLDDAALEGEGYIARHLLRALPLLGLV